MSYRVAMDIGGTFTDFVVIDEGEQLTSTGKTSTTPARPEQGVLEGLVQVVPELREISFIVHGTTVGLNAFLELGAVPARLDWLYTVAWSPDGKYIASGGVDKSIRVYAPGPQGAKARALRLRPPGAGPEDPVLEGLEDALLRRAGRLLKSWDVERMVERKVYDRQPETVLSMAKAARRQANCAGPLRRRGRADRRGDGESAGRDRQAQPEEAAGRRAQPEKKAAFEIKSIVPPAVTRGKATRVTFNGTGIDQLDRDIKVNIPGGVIGVQIGRPDPFYVELTVPATTPPGSYKFQLKTTAGATAEVPVIVDAYDAVPEKDAGESPATGQKITLPTTIAGSLDRTGDVDFYRFEAKKGQQLGVQIVTATIGSKVEPALQLIDLSGRVLSESNAGHLGWTFADGGTFAIGVRDRDLRGGANMHYRLHLGEIPVVTAIFPLGLQRGSEADIRVQGVFLGTDKVHVKAPADAAVGSKIPVPLTTPRGTPLGNLQLTVGEFAESLADAIAVPGTGNGVVAEPGAAQNWSFHAKNGQRLIVEVHARRLGSDLDSFIEILDKAGQPVPRAVLRCQAKTYVTFRDHDSAGAGIRIESWSELGTNDFLYVGGELLKIQDLPPGPDADCTFFNTAGQRLGFLDTTPTHHALNTPMYKVGIHPPGSTFPPNGFPVFTLYYRNDDGGPGYGRDSRIFFDPPADGEYRVRIRDARGLGGPGYAYRLTVRPPRPSFSVRFSPTARRSRRAAPPGGDLRRPHRRLRRPDRAAFRQSAARPVRPAHGHRGRHLQHRRRHLRRARRRIARQAAALSSSAKRRSTARSSSRKRWARPRS